MWGQIGSARASAARSRCRGASRSARLPARVFAVGEGLAPPGRTLLYHNRKVRRTRKSCEFAGPFFLFGPCTAGRGQAAAPTAETSSGASRHLPRARGRLWAAGGVSPYGGDGAGRSCPWACENLALRRGRDPSLARSHDMAGTSSGASRHLPRARGRLWAAGCA